MTKRLIYILIAFVFMFAVPCFATTTINDEFLFSEYGPTLKSPPFFLRYKYQKENGKEWKDASLDERKEFLKAYHTDLAETTKKEQEEKEAKTKADRQAMREQDLKKRQEAQKQKAYAKAERERLKAEAEEKKQFDERIEQNEKALENLHDIQKNSKRRLND